MVSETEQLSHKVTIKWVDQKPIDMSDVIRSFHGRNITAQLRVEMVGALNDRLHLLLSTGELTELPDESWAVAIVDGIIGYRTW